MSLESYIYNLKNVGKISRLFSDNPIPYLYYRAHENIYCREMGAKNLSRSDIAIDAKKGNVGVGLKTFTGSNASFQKVAEFNKASKNFRNLENKEKIIEVCKLRNERLHFAKAVSEVDSLKYHCLIRIEGEFRIYEEEMNYVDVDKVRITKVAPTTIKFTDDKEEYSFSLSKSTLSKKFKFSDDQLVAKFEVEILEDPYSYLEASGSNINNSTLETQIVNSIVLPLYSTSRSKGQIENKYIPEKSGLNHWNAGGRSRNSREVYFPIPSKIYNAWDQFMPPRSVKFEVQLPSGEKLKVSRCQGRGKALMSDPNSDLGEWICKMIPHIEDREIATIQDLYNAGVDSVIISKNKKEEYFLDIAEWGSYDEYLQKIEEENVGN